MFGIQTALQKYRRIDVLNGIAYDVKNDRLFVTGKLWPKLFEIELVVPEK
jgi:glutamine cyclotransferase